MSHNEEEATSNVTTDENENANANGSKSESESESEVKVVVQHKVLSISECFIYRIPPMKSSGGHRAEDWNLASALATCSLEMVEKDDVLLVNLMGDQPKKDGPKGATEKFLFAQSQMDLWNNTEKSSTSYWAEPVVDSSRYFVLRILNEKTKREASIGIGFRERNDAVNFRMGMQDYERAIRRQQQATSYSDAEQEVKDKDAGTDADVNANANDELSTKMGQFSLKEGETIHIDIKSNKRRNSNSTKSKTKSTTGAFLLRKPPPAASSNTAATTSNTSSIDQGKDDTNKNENDDDDDDDDDEWGDFQ